ncbi:MAG: hypothetical protein WBE26_14150, partial [Phycisphaerae bacterium]
LPPTQTQVGSRQRCTWDTEGFRSWPSLDRPLRVVRSLETTTVRRQLDKQEEPQLSGWVWVTTLSNSRASTNAVVDLGHARWDIENQGFNEAVNQWHSDHVYKHDPTAILAFWLLTMLVLNVFRAFYLRNLKPQRRRHSSMLHIARCLIAELYQGWANICYRSQPDPAPLQHLIHADRAAQCSHHARRHPSVLTDQTHAAASTENASNSADRGRTTMPPLQEEPKPRHSRALRRHLRNRCKTNLTLAKRKPLWYA